MLELGEGDAIEEIEIDFGHLDSTTELSGIQKRLGNLGFACGEPDGQPGPLTSRALEAFQQRVGLPVTGEPDEHARPPPAGDHQPPGEAPHDLPVQLLRHRRRRRGADRARREVRDWHDPPGGSGEHAQGTVVVSVTTAQASTKGHAFTVSSTASPGGEVLTCGKRPYAPKLDLTVKTSRVRRKSGGRSAEQIATSKKRKLTAFQETKDDAKSKLKEQLRMKRSKVDLDALDYGEFAMLLDEKATTIVKANADDTFWAGPVSRGADELSRWLDDQSWGPIELSDDEELADEADEMEEEPGAGDGNQSD